MALVIPTSLAAEEHLAVGHLHRVLEQFAARDGLEIRTHYRPGLDGGCLFALEEVAYEEEEED